MGALFQGALRVSPGLVFSRRHSCRKGLVTMPCAADLDGEVSFFCQVCLGVGERDWLAGSWCRETLTLCSGHQEEESQFPSNYYSYYYSYYVLQLQLLIGATMRLTPYAHSPIHLQPAILRHYEPRLSPLAGTYLSPGKNRGKTCRKNPGTLFHLTRYRREPLLPAKEEKNVLTRCVHCIPGT